MYDSIRSEVAQFAHDYILQEQPIEAAQLLAEGKVGELRRLFETIFTGDTRLNPEGKSAKEFFTSATQTELDAKIANAREKLALHSYVPFSRLIAVSESLMVRNVEDRRERYTSMFDVGLYQSVMRQELRFDSDFDERDLQFLIHNQSPEYYRSLVELASNAVDFSPKGSEVMVNIRENGFLITDYGSGMDEQEVMEQLIVPFLSGARNPATAPIGKFGMGFLTVMRHLKAEGDHVLLETGKNNTGIFIEFVFKQGRLQSRLGRQERHTQGTRIFVKCKDFVQETAQHYVRKELAYKRNSQIFIDDQEVEVDGSIDFIDTTVREHEREAITSVGYTINTDPNAQFNTKSVCEITICINGIKTLSDVSLSVNVPRNLVIDLLYDTNLAESRDSLVYDDVLYRNGILLVDSVINDKHVSLEDKVQIINGMAEFFFSMEAKGNNKSASILKYLEEKTHEMISQTGKLCLPAIQHIYDVAVSDALYINPRLTKVYQATLASLPVANSVTDVGKVWHVVSFREDALQGVVVCGDRILVDREILKNLRQYPELIIEFLQKFSSTATFSEFLDIKKVIASSDKAIFEKNRSSSRRLVEPFDQQLLPSQSVQFNDFELNSVKLLYQKFFPILDKEIPKGMKSVVEFLILKMEDEKIFESLIDPRIPNPISAEMYAAFYQRVLAFLDTTEIDDDEIFSNDYPRTSYDPSLTREDVRNSVKILLEKNPITIEMTDNFEKIRKMASVFFSEKLNEIEYATVEDKERAICLHIADVLNTTDQSSSDKLRATPSYEVVKEIWEVVAKNKISHEYYEIINELFYRKFNQVLNALRTEKLYIESLAKLDRKVAEKVALLHRINMHHALTASYFSTPYNLAYHEQYEQYQNHLASFIRIATELDENEFAHFSNLLQSGMYNPQELIMLAVWSIDPALVAIKHRENWGYESYDESTTILNYFGRNQGKEQSAAYELIANQKMSNSKRKKTKNAFKNKIRFCEREAQDLGAKSIFSTLVRKQQQLFNNSQLRELIEGNTFEKISNALLMGDGHWAKLSPTGSRKIMNNFEGSVALFSPTKELIIARAVKKIMDSADSSASKDERVLRYLYRIFNKANLSDGDFEYFQPWLESERTLINGKVAGNVEDDRIYHPALQNLILRERQKIEQFGLPTLFKLWTAIATSGTFFSIEAEKLASILERLIDILEDIFSKPKYVVESIMKKIKGDNDFQYRIFLNRYISLESIDYELRPYFLYFWQESGKEILSHKTEYSLPEKAQKTKMSSLMLLRRAQHRSYAKLKSDPENLFDTANEYSLNKNTYIYNRELLHAITHLPMHDEYLYIRELLQNAYDASKEGDLEGQEKEAHVVQVHTSVINKLLVTEISDTIGMDKETLFGSLLLPNESTKKHGEALGRFGIGFFSVFKGAEKVEIETDNGETRYVVEVIPLLNDRGDIFDLQIQYVEQASVKSGTVIRKFTNSENPNLERSKVEAATYRYGQYLPSSSLNVMIEEKKVNTDKVVYAEENHPELGRIAIMEGKEKALLQGQLFVTDLPEIFDHFIPYELKKLIDKLGLVVDIDPIVELTRSRKDLADSSKLRSLLLEVMPRLIIRAIIARKDDGELLKALIPNDFLIMFQTATLQDLEVLELVKADVQSILNQQEINWQFYSIFSNLQILMMHIPIVELFGEMRSIRDIADLHHKNFDVLNEEGIPPGLRSFLESALLYSIYDKSVKNKFQRDELVPLPKILISGRNGEIGNSIERELTVRSDAHLAFLMMMQIMHKYSNTLQFMNLEKQVQGINGININQGFYMKDEVYWLSSPSIITLYWNLMHLQDHIEDLGEQLRNGTLSRSAVAKIATSFTHASAWVNAKRKHISDFQQGGEHWENRMLSQKYLLARNFAACVDEVYRFLQQFNGTCMNITEISILLEKMRTDSDETFN